MKRVLFFNENPIPSIYTRGTIAAKELRLRAAIDEIDEVHVITRPGKSIQTNDVSVGPLEKKVFVHLTIPWPYYFTGLVHFFYGIYFILKLRPILLEAESGIISGPAVVVLGKIFKLPTVVELRASYEELIKIHAMIVPYFVKKHLLRIVTHFSYSNVTALIANSKTYQKYLKKRGFKSVEINPGLQYAPSYPINTKRQKIICYLGRLVEEKGVDDLLRAVEMIQSELIRRSWRVWIVGDGIERTKLERLSQELNIESLVSFKGSQKNYETLSKVKILVNPCFVKHPLEMVNVEAASMNVPVICYGDHRVPETVIDNRTGIKVPYRNVSQMSKAILRLVTNEKLQKRLGDQGFSFAKYNYAFSRQVKLLARLYYSMKVI